jgi:hypothetical protein
MKLLKLNASTNSFEKKELIYYPSHIGNLGTAAVDVLEHDGSKF